MKYHFLMNLKGWNCLLLSTFESGVEIYLCRYICSHGEILVCENMISNNRSIYYFSQPGSHSQQPEILIQILR